MKTKICSHCYKELPLTKFYKDKNRKDRSGRYCKICANKASRKSQAKAYADSIKRQKILNNQRERSKKSHTKNRSTPEGRAKANEASKKSNAKRYASDPEFREYMKKHSDKRHRDYGGIRIAENIIDELVIRHHVNDNEVIDVPRDIHVMYPTHPKKQHRFMVNQVVEQIYGIKIKEI